MWGGVRPPAIRLRYTLSYTPELYPALFGQRIGLVIRHEINLPHRLA